MTSQGGGDEHVVVPGGHRPLSRDGQAGRAHGPQHLDRIWSLIATTASGEPASRSRVIGNDTSPRWSARRTELARALGRGDARGHRPAVDPRVYPRVDHSVDGSVEA